MQQNEFCKHPYIICKCSRKLWTGWFIADGLMNFVLCLDIMLGLDYIVLRNCTRFSSLLSLHFQAQKDHTLICYSSLHDQSLIGRFNLVIIMIGLVKDLNCAVALNRVWRWKTRTESLIQCVSWMVAAQRSIVFYHLRSRLRRCVVASCIMYIQVYIISLAHSVCLLL